ncbi:exonuclease subunit SbcD [Treponema parvum]|uniref:Nuclease SbcCD subunit D n=1 Tax=Treponema parvum TaxID=138851 RepID=A0A975ICX8_9SPIR|nr:exonuclease SbcCD subunit D [Treponema parvum]QTQ11564.1 exonuclease subunit SbcD [Treponema parvum]
MKFLQTGDWHLGKVFYGQSLTEDQAFFLEQIFGELEKAEKELKPYDALVVPGDIYDRAVPPVESVTLLSSFLSRTHEKFPDLEMFFLAGNHDSASRLSFASELLGKSNVHICTDTKHLEEPVIVGKGNEAAAVYQIPFLMPGSIAAAAPAHPAAFSADAAGRTDMPDKTGGAGPNVAGAGMPDKTARACSAGMADTAGRTDKIGGAEHNASDRNFAEPLQLNEFPAAEDTLFAASDEPEILPDEPLDWDEEKILRSQQQLAAQAFDLIRKSHLKNYPSMPSVVCAHMFATGASVSESERSWVGAAEQVDVRVFEGITYTALGHIHTVQRLGGRNAWYSGAPLAYSFSENSEKCMLSVTVLPPRTDKGCPLTDISDVKVEKIAIKPLHPVVRLTGAFEEFYKQVVSGLEDKKLKESYVEIQCTDKLPHENAIQLLRAGYPYLLSFTRASEISDEIQNTVEARKAILSSGKKDEGGVFDLFMKETSNTYQEDPSFYKKERELFIALSKESER